jgi:protein phosphatase
LLGKQSVKLVAAGKTDPGRVREQNEDSILLAPGLSLFLVCDGMGGHATGHIASKLAVKSIHNFFEATAQGPLEEPSHPDDGDASPEGRRLASAIRKANRDVHEISTSHERHKGMGSTAVALHVHGDTAVIAHTGDSRCYLLRDGALKQLTRDHSLYNEALALKPDLSPEKLAKLPKNVVTRALGMKDKIQVELGATPVEPGDLFLLCSDGLYNMVKEEDIVELLGLQEDLAESCDLLVAMANDAGGTDNISVVLVRVEEAPPPSGPALQVVEELDEPPPSEPPPEPPPNSGPLTPAATVFLRDETNDELSEIEESLAAVEQAKNEILEGAPRELGDCPSCSFPRLTGNDFCVECGHPLP